MKNIIRFLTAQTISLLGSSLVQYAIVWYITLSTSSGKMMTIATACGFLPQILISLFAGVWADRYNRKVLCMVSDGIIAFATLILAVLFLSGYKSIWLLFAVLLIRSAGTGVQTPTVNAIIPQIVPKEYLMKVNGINSTITALIMLLSPALSGAIISVMSIEATFFIDVITAVIGIGITATVAVPRLKEHAGQARSSLYDIREGFRYLKKNEFVKNFLVYQVVTLILISPSAFLTPLLVSRTFGAEVWRLTISEMTFSAGAVFGGLLMTVWGGFKNRRHTMLAGVLAYGVLMVGLGLAPVYLVYLVVNMSIGITMPIYNTPATAILQEEVEPEMHGRVFSLVQISGSCALPLGMMIFGPAADIVRIQWLLLGCGSLVFLCTAYAFGKRIFS